MPETSPMDDNVLEDLLAQALERTDAVPGATSDAARNLLRWRRPDADLATLGLADTVPVRSGATVTAHRFETGDLEVEVAVDGSSLDGLIDPWPDDAVATLETLRGEIPVSVDETGEFELALTADQLGPIRLLINTGDRQIRTEWILAGRPPSGSS